jgi:hypothetical protein
VAARARVTVAFDDLGDTVLLSLRSGRVGVFAGDFEGWSERREEAGRRELELRAARERRVATPPPWRLERSALATDRYLQTEF